MKIKLLLDENIQIDLAVQLRKREYNATHAQEIGRKGCSDLDQLLYAIQEQQCIVTFDRKDFAQLHDQYVQNNREHFGIIISKRRSIGETLRRLVTILENRSQKDIKNQLIWL